MNLTTIKEMTADPRLIRSIVSGKTNTEEETISDKEKIMLNETARLKQIEYSSISK